MTMAIAFSRQNDDASRERTLLWENLVLVVVLESFLICKHGRKLHAMLKPFSDISLTLFKAWGLNLTRSAKGKKKSSTRYKIITDNRNMNKTYETCTTTTLFIQDSK